MAIPIPSDGSLADPRPRWGIPDAAIGWVIAYCFAIIGAVRMRPSVLVGVHAKAVRVRLDVELLGGGSLQAGADLGRRRYRARRYERYERHEHYDSSGRKTSHASGLPRCLGGCKPESFVSGG